MKNAIKRAAKALALILCLCLTAGAAPAKADALDMVNLLSPWIEGDEAQLSVSYEIKNLLPYNDSTLTLLNNVLKHITVEGRVSGNDTSMGISVDGDSLFTLEETQENGRSVLRTELLPNRELTAARQTLVELLNLMDAQSYYTDAAAWSAQFAVAAPDKRLTIIAPDGSVLSASDLEKELRAIPGEIILLADCCGSGGLLGAASDQEKMIDGVTSVFQGAIGKTSLGTSKYHVLASALLDQDSHRISFSGADENDMATVFARAVCDALGWSMDRSAQSAMNADSDYDGEVTFDELYRYVSRRIKWYLSLAGEYAQNAVAGAEGDEFVVFARTDAE